MKNVNSDQAKLSNVVTNEKEDPTMKSNVAEIIRSANILAAKEALRREANEQKAEEREALKEMRSNLRTVTKRERAKIERYRILKINFAAMMGSEGMRLVDKMKAMNEKDDESIDAGRKAYTDLMEYIDNIGMFHVKMEQCRTENTSRSLASDIAGVAYGRTTARIVVVSHNVLNEINCNKKLLGNHNTAEGEKMLDDLSKKILDKLVKVGISVKFSEEDVKAYKVWAATSSQQKTGSVYCGEVEMMRRMAPVINYGVRMVFGESKDTGAEFLKRQALLFTPSVPIVREDGSYVRLRDVIMIDDIEIDRIVSYALRIGMDASFSFVKDKLFSELTNGLKTMFDGQVLSESIPSCQMRGFGIKGFNVCIKGMPHWLAMVYGVINLIEDIDHNFVEYNPNKVLMVKSCWKGSKLGISWSEFVKRAEELTTLCPLLDCLRVVRYADSTEEHKRKLTRQTIQQFMFATDEQLSKLTKGECAKLNSQKRLDGALVKYANLTEKLENRTAIERLYELNPSILCSGLLKQMRKQNWEADLADSAAGRVTAHGAYPYIAMDPVAFLQIVMFGFDPNGEKLGYLAADEINAPDLLDGQKVYAVRYPNNHICGQILTNRHHDIYAPCGDVAIIPYDGFVIDAFDGDFDGDEMSITTDKVVIDMMEETLSKIKVPLILFAHEKAKGNGGNMADQVVTALFNGMKYNKVGVFSNLATKIMQKMALATDRKIKNQLFVDAAFAHVGTILVIDMIKTGFMPTAIEEKLNRLLKAHKEMPWNQRFNRHTTENPYTSIGWDETTLAKTESVCDRLAAQIIDNVDEYSFDDMGLTFDADVMLSKHENLPGNISKGVVTNKWFARLNLANFNGDDKAVLAAIRAKQEVSPKELMKFLWNNYAALNRTMKVECDSESKAAAQKAAYLAMARDCIIELPKTSARWQTYTEDQQINGIVNVFLRDAFELSGHGNGIDVAKKGSYAQFVLSVFSKDILRTVEENLDVPAEERFDNLHKAAEEDELFFDLFADDVE